MCMYCVFVSNCGYLLCTCVHVNISLFVLLITAGINVLLHGQTLETTGLKFCVMGHLPNFYRHKHFMFTPVKPSMFLFLIDVEINPIERIVSNIQVSNKVLTSDKNLHSFSCFSQQF